MATLTHSQLVTLWEIEGGSGLAADTAAAVAQAESGGRTDAILNTAYPSRPGYRKPSPGAQPEYSVGLWQINMRAHPSYSQAFLLTATGNAQAAIAISGNGASWSPWSTYTNGAYKQFLQTPGTSTPANVTSSTQPIHSMQGWNAVTRALAGDIPSALNKARAVNRAALRVLR
jgi:hypothetical protein